MDNAESFALCLRQQNSTDDHPQLNRIRRRPNHRDRSCLRFCALEHIAVLSTVMTLGISVSEGLLAVYKDLCVFPQLEAPVGSIAKDVQSRVEAFGSSCEVVHRVTRERPQ